MNDQYYTCICGKTHLKSKDVHCSGPGHQVYISKAYFNYSTDAREASQQQPKQQLKMF